VASAGKLSDTEQKPWKRCVIDTVSKAKIVRSKNLTLAFRDEFAVLDVKSYFVFRTV
jgi:hypothetical protein